MLTKELPSFIIMEEGLYKEEEGKCGEEEEGGGGREKRSFFRPAIGPSLLLHFRNPFRQFPADNPGSPLLKAGSAPSVLIAERARGIKNGVFIFSLADFHCLDT